jgi:phytol kinase
MSYFITYLILLISIIFAINWLAKREIVNIQSARKLTHTFTGIVVCSFPLYLSSVQIIILSGIFVVLMCIAKLRKILVLNKVERTTWGEVYFPASVGVCALLSLPQHMNAYFVGILCLTFADTAANIIGNRIPLKVIKIGSQTKSVGGLSACILMVFLILSVFFPLTDNSWYLILIASILVGFVEVFSIYGIDNISVPLVATLLSLWINGGVKI